jgi:hypothetical protein
MISELMGLSATVESQGASRNYLGPSVLQMPLMNVLKFNHAME